MNVSIGQNRALLLAAMAAAAAILFFPAEQFLQQRHHMADLQSKLAQLHSQNGELAKESKRLNDPRELELLARQRLGLVRPGERAYFIEPSAPARKVAGTVVHRASFVGRAWHWLTSVVHGRN
ncbi:MAG: Septum formation initiator [Thermoleophilaceae bacterium]|nr:Septum formation initiator [Thermoleophilaceae bacterium]